MTPPTCLCCDEPAAFIHIPTGATFCADHADYPTLLEG